MVYKFVYFTSLYAQCSSTICRNIVLARRSDSVDSGAVCISSFDGCDVWSSWQLETRKDTRKETRKESRKVGKWKEAILFVGQDSIWYMIVCVMMWWYDMLIGCCEALYYYSRYNTKQHHHAGSIVRFSEDDPAPVVVALPLPGCCRLVLLFVPALATSFVPSLGRWFWRVLLRIVVVVLLCLLWGYMVTWVRVRPLGRDKISSIRRSQNRCHIRWLLALVLMRKQLDPIRPLRFSRFPLS